MRALVIAPQPFFTPSGTPLSVYYRSLVTAQLGVKVDLLMYGHGADVEIPGVRIIRIPKFSFLGPVRIGPSYLKLFLDSVLILWTVGLLLKRQYDFVHAHEEAVFWCRFLKPLFRFALVYDMHSSLPQQLVNFRFTSSKVLIGLFRHLEGISLRHADVVITICKDLEQHALARGVAPQRHVLIENSIFEDVRTTSSTVLTENPATLTNEALDAVLPPSSPVIAYAGTFEEYQGLDLLLSAFARVLEKAPAARLLMIGGSPSQVAEKRRVAACLAVDDNCIFTGQVSKGRAMELTRRASVLVSPRMDGTNTPLKIYEQLASGKPLVATRIWSHTQVLDDQVCILVDPSPQAMADGLLKALTGDGAQEYVLKAKALYEMVYSRSIYEAKVSSMLQLIPVNKTHPLRWRDDCAS